MSEPYEHIRQCDPLAAYLAQNEAIDKAIARVLTHGRYILGAEVTAFEAEFAAFVGVDHCLGVANGTDALALALRATGIGPGDAVLTISHTAVATIAAIRSTGATPLFVDVTTNEGLMDPAQVEAVLTKAARDRLHTAAGRIRAIVPVHLYGCCVDMESLGALAQRHGLPIIEDCAQAHGARHGAKRAGSFGEISAFSFYPTKNLGAVGDGGAVVSDNKALMTRVRLLREYGWRERYVSEIEGANSRLDELQAAILRVKLPRLDEDNARRVALARIYRAGLSNPHICTTPIRDDGHVYHQFTIRCRDRDGLKAHLRARNIDSLIHYPCPVHLQPAYRDICFMAHPLPETERWAEEVLSLPMYPELPLEHAMHVAAAVNDWVPRD